MSGTIDGGKKAAATNRQRYGLQFYKFIGTLGGQKSRGGGFATNRELARTAGAKGGANSRRTKNMLLARNHYGCNFSVETGYCSDHEVQTRNQSTTNAHGQEERTK